MTRSAARPASRPSRLSVTAADRPALRLLLPVFALVTAANVAAMSFAKALFIDHNDYSALPWMYLGAAGFTAAVTLLYVRALERVQIQRRFAALLALGGASYIVLALVVPRAPGELSLVAFVWCAGMGQLVLMQVWAYSTALLPVRQARRLFPILAAAATFGAALGGGITGSLPGLVGLEGLLLLASAFLLGALVLLRRAAAQLRVILPGVDREQAEPRARPSAGRGLSTALASLRSVPLLGQLGVLAMALQAGSVLLDFQFASALKHSWDAEEMATFLGFYYGAANLLTFGLAVAFGSKIVDRVGVGVAAAAAAIPLAVGGAICVALDQAGAPGLLWAVIVTSFLERVATFGLARHAAGAAMTPVDPRLAERARFVIDGIGLRLVTVVVSLSLLAGGAVIEDVGALAPLVVVAAVVALVLGLRLGVTYRRTLVELLRRGAAAPADLDAVRRWTGRQAAQGIARLLTSQDRADVLAGLEHATSLQLELPAEALSGLLEGSDVELLTSALVTLARVGPAPPPEALLPHLAPDGPPALIQAAVRAAPFDSALLRPALAELVNHADPLIACLALRRLGTAGASDLRWSEVLAAVGDGSPPPSPSPPSPPSPRAGELAEYLRELPMMLAHPGDEVRRATRAAIAALNLPELGALLVAALGTPVASVAAASLEQLAPETVRPALVRALGDPGADRGDSRPAPVVTLRLLLLAERLGLAAPLVGYAGSDRQLERSFAVAALWRLTRRFPLEPVQREALAVEARYDVARLDHLTTLAAGLAAPATERLRFLAREVGLRRASVLRRAVELVGLACDRAAAERALLYLGSASARDRSNAVELLDGAVSRPDLRPLLGHLEAEPGALPAAETPPVVRPSSAALAAAADAVDQELGSLYRWGVGGTSDELPPQPHPLHLPLHRMDRALLLHRIPLFAQTPADQLLGLASACRQVLYAAGEEIFRPGDPARHLYLLEQGQVEVLRDGVAVATFGPKECFGELAILADAERRTTARAVTDVDCLVLTRDDFQGVLETSPELARATIAVLAGRVRGLLERLT